MRRIHSVFLIFVLLFIGACKNSSDNKGIDLNIKLLPEKVTDFLYLKMKYDLSLNDNYMELGNNYQMFVHFWRIKNKEMLIQDDHSLPKKTSEWKKGDQFSYEREIFIPKFIDEFDIDFEGYEEIRLTIGLYNPENQKDRIILSKKTLSFESVSLNAPEIIFDEGWFPPETNLRIKNTEERSWRWTGKKATCIIENPKKPSTLIIRGAVDKTRFEDKRILFKINDQVLEEFIPEDNGFTKKYTILPDQMGGQDEFILTIETDKPFIPSSLDPESKDNRELGIQIFFLYFREAVND